MKNPDIDQLLKRMGKEPLPGIPSTFQKDVWKEIHHRQAVQPLSWREQLERSLALLLQPMPVAASLLLALLVGIAGTLPFQSHTPTSLGLYAFNPKTADISLPGKF